MGITLSEHYWLAKIKILRKKFRNDVMYIYVLYHLTVIE